jgi:CRP/FNR family cyclic AMP-dependent transcriptional regulator
MLRYNHSQGSKPGMPKPTLLRKGSLMPGIAQNVIGEASLFRGFSPQQIDWIGERLHLRVYPAGASLITVEQPGEVVYIVLHGTLKIHVEQAGGSDVILAILGPGDVVGEMSLIDSVGRSASVITLEESQMFWMSAGTFQECLQTIPVFAQNLVRMMSARVRLANELIQALATLDVHGRVARQLLAFSEKYGEPSQEGRLLIPIRLTQGDIADLVGASRKRVNQVMVTFKQQGLIAVDEKGRITVYDRKALARLCV